MNFQEQLHSKRHQLHVRMRREAREIEPFLNQTRLKFIRMIQREIQGEQTIPFQTALNNIKQNINIVQSLRSLVGGLQKAEDSKIKLKMILSIVDRGILHHLTKIFEQNSIVKETLELVLLISSYAQKNTGNYIIRSGILSFLFDKGCGADKTYLRKFLAILGNLCHESADNRNVVGDSQIHLDIIKQLRNKCEQNNYLYNQQQCSPEEKKLWIYKMWFLQQFYAYDIIGDESKQYPQELTQALIILLSIHTPYEILERAITLLSIYKINKIYYQQLSKRIEMLLEENIKHQQIYNLLYLVSQLHQLPIRNYKIFLRLYNPQYFGRQIDNNKYQSFVTRILYYRRDQIDNVPELHQQTFWSNIMNMSLPPYDRHMVLNILTSINLQNIEWVFEQLCITLNQNKDNIEILAGLNFILAQIDRKGKNIVGGIIRQTGLNVMLNNLVANKNKEVYTKLETILELYN